MYFIIWSELGSIGRPWYNASHMSKFNRILGLSTAASSLTLVGSAYMLTRFVRKSLNHSVHAGIHSNMPKVTLMVPCKDLDPDFRENMQMLIEQDYPNYEIIFMTINDRDDSYPILKEMAEKSPVPAQVVFGGFSKKRCQKLDNMIAALDHISDESEIMAWVDSDARVTRDWLRHLVAPLEQPEVGATTTYRWYRPEKGRPLTYLLGLWTALQTCHLHIEKARATWGGSMAIRRQTFIDLNLRTIWNTALSDDCVLNDTVRKAGLKVEFVAPSMTSASSDLPTKDILIFTTRQCVIGKHTLKEVWWLSILGLSFFHFATGRGFWLTGKALKQRRKPEWAALGMLSFIPAGIIQASLVLNSLRQLSDSREADDPLVAKYHWSLLTPFAYLFLWCSMLASATTDKFVWRKIYYKMLNAHETEVYDYPPELDADNPKEVAPPAHEMP